MPTDLATLVNWLSRNPDALALVGLIGALVIATGLLFLSRFLGGLVYLCTGLVVVWYATKIDSGHGLEFVGTFTFGIFIAVLGFVLMVASPMLKRR